MFFDLYEPNNTFGTAQPLDIGSYSVTGSDADWYQVDLEPGAFYAQMTPSSGQDINMIMYNSSQQVVAANFASGQESIDYHVSTAGMYYLKIEPTSQSSSAYQLVLSDTASHSGDDAYDTQTGGNDTLSFAANLGSSNVSLSSLVANDDDAYKVKVYPGVFSIDVTPGLLVEIFNSAQVRVADSLNAGSTSFDLEVTQTGDYYVLISGGSGSTYSMSLSSQTVWATELDFGPIRDASIALFDIDQDGKDEIFVATSKALDAQMNEIRPAGLICLEDDGSIKWSATFPAMSSPDPQTGKTYNTTSVSTSPAFSDLDGDGNIDIVIGVGGDTFGEAGADVVGQPGDKGGVYALNADGTLKWFHESLDTIGGTLNTGDGRPDGVYSSPVVFDIDNDGVKEVIYGGWDQSLWILDGRTGSSEKEVHLADTIWSTPRIADINEDGTFEILINADITQNTEAQVQTGGIFHVISADGSQNIAGFNTPVGNPNFTMLNGKWEEQALWSSPVTADLDGDGHLEIIYGTGNFFHDSRGEFIRVWNHDGTNLFQLSTVGRTFSTPVVADINGDGAQEIVATTLDGYVFAWDAQGSQLFATQTLSFGNGSTPSPIFSSPVVVDVSGDGKMEILYTQGTQIIIVNSQGVILSDNASRELVFEQYKGSVAVKDIDDDGTLDILSGGSTASKDQAVVYRYELNNSPQTDTFLNGRYQFHQSTSNVTSFVDRFYSTVLGRNAEAAGEIYWTDSLVSGTRAGADVARGFIFSQEFANRGLDDAAYVNVLYQAFFNRAADSAGYADWMTQLQNGADRATVLDGFIFSQEFKNLCSAYSIVPAK